MRVLVTGGSGFVGSHITDVLLGRGHSVLAADLAIGENLAAASDQPRFEFASCDVTRPDRVLDVVDGSVDLVVHTAAVVGVSHYLADPIRVIDVNVGGTRNVVAACLEYRTRLAFASTSETYGKNPKVPWSEEDDRVVGPTSVDRWSYSTSKATAEHLVLGAHRHHGLPVSVVRYFNLYGPRQQPNYVISKSIHRALNGLPPLLYDSGSQTRCFTYITDAVEGTIAAATQEEAVGKAFNVGSDVETSIGEVIRLVQTHTGFAESPEPFLTSREYGNSYQDVTRRIPDISKARRLLGWSPTTDLEKGIRHTVRWARHNPDWLRTGDWKSASAPTTTLT